MQEVLNLRLVPEIVALELGQFGLFLRSSTPIVTNMKSAGAAIKCATYAFSEKLSQFKCLIAIDPATMLIFGARAINSIRMQSLAAFWNLIDPSRTHSLSTAQSSSLKDK